MSNSIASNNVHLWELQTNYADMIVECTEEELSEKCQQYTKMWTGRGFRLSECFFSYRPLIKTSLYEIQMPPKEYNPFKGGFSVFLSRASAEQLIDALIRVCEKPIEDE